MANGCEIEKQGFPYESLDDYSKLSHVGLVKYEDFYSKLQGKINITPEEYENFKSEFYNKGCVAMKNWLKYTT